MMKNGRVFLVSLLCLTALPTGPVAGAEKDPFAVKFGGPHQEDVSQEFRRDLVEYERGLKNAFAALGIAGLKDKDGFAEFNKDFLEPAITKVNPKTEPETKLKAAAVQVKEAVAFVADPASLAENRHEAMKAFLKASVRPGEPPTETQQVAGLLLRFSAYVRGKSLETTEEVKPVDK